MNQQNYTPLYLQRQKYTSQEKPKKAEEEMLVDG